VLAGTPDAFVKVFCVRGATRARHCKDFSAAYVYTVKGDLTTRQPARTRTAAKAKAGTMVLEHTAAAADIAPGPATIPAPAPGLWRVLAQCATAGSVLFFTVFLVISLVALFRTRAQDIPETVRALAQLLHPPTRRRSDKADRR